MFLQKKEREEREKREGKDDRSFFQKYVRQSQDILSRSSHTFFFLSQWVYILIGVFLVMTLNSAGAAAGGGGGS